MNNLKLLSKIIGSFVTDNYHYNERNRSYTLHTEPEITIYVSKETPKTGKPESSRHRAFKNSALAGYLNMKGET